MDVMMVAMTDERKVGQKAMQRAETRALSMVGHWVRLMAVSWVAKKEDTMVVRMAETTGKRLVACLADWKAARSEYLMVAQMEAKLADWKEFQLVACSAACLVAAMVAQMAAMWAGQKAIQTAVCLDD